MADDTRNFRTYYYEKYGIIGVDGKKSVEILLKEHPLHLDKLRQFCLRFQVPAIYRVILWKVLLGVLPINQNSNEFVMKQRTKQYEDLEHALKIMRRITSKTELPEIFLKMFLIEEGSLLFEDEQLLADHKSKVFHSIATAVTSTIEDNVDAYWISTHFYRYYAQFKDTLLALPEKTDQYLKKEDDNKKLYNHLHKYGVFAALPISMWFATCFAHVLPETSHEKIWDKVIGGSCMILVFVAVAIFRLLQRPLLSMHSTADMVNYLNKLPEDTGDAIAHLAIDLWTKYGYHQTKSDSPNFIERSP